MKRHLLISVALIVSLMILVPLGYRTFVLQIQTYNMDVLQEKHYSDPQYGSLPLYSPHIAAQYAIHSDKYELPMEYPKSGNWLVRTERVYNLSHADKTWRVTIFSTFRPRYFCILEFTSNMEWIVENNCHQNGK